MGGWGGCGSCRGRWRRAHELLCLGRCSLHACRPPPHCPTTCAAGLCCVLVHLTPLPVCPTPAPPAPSTGLCWGRAAPGAVRGWGGVGRAGRRAGRVWGVTCLPAARPSNASVLTAGWLHLLLRQTAATDPVRRSARRCRVCREVQAGGPGIAGFEPSLPRFVSGISLGGCIALHSALADRASGSQLFR